MFNLQLCSRVLLPVLLLLPAVRDGLLLLPLSKMACADYCWTPPLSKMACADYCWTSPLLCRLSALVCRNALLVPCQDLPISSSRRDRVASLAGIWPLVTGFNHSCAANAVAVVLGEVPDPQQQQQQQLTAGGRHRDGRGGGTASVGNKQHAAGAKATPRNPWLSSSSKHRRVQSPASNSSSSSSSSSGELGRGLTRHHLPGSIQSWSPLHGLSQGPVVLVRAVTDMAPGDEVTLDYLAGSAEGNLVHLDRRRTVLAKRWAFSCRCGVWGGSSCGPAVTSCASRSQQHHV
jgi:hypothetical protein